MGIVSGFRAFDQELVCYQNTVLSALLLSWHASIEISFSQNYTKPQHLVATGAAATHDGAATQPDVESYSIFVTLCLPYMSRTMNPDLTPHDTAG